MGQKSSDLPESAVHVDLDSGDVRCVLGRKKPTVAATSSGCPKRFIVLPVLLTEIDEPP
jgi:hypothetical protein